MPYFYRKKKKLVSTYYLRFYFIFGKDGIIWGLEVFPQILEMWRGCQNKIHADCNSQKLGLPYH